MRRPGLPLTAWIHQMNHKEDTHPMSKLFRYGGIAASIALIVFGIGAVATGFSGRDQVRSNLAREQIVGTAGLEHPRPEGRHRQRGASLCQGDAQAHPRGHRRSDVLPDGPVSRQGRQADQRRQGSRHRPKTQKPVSNPARQIWVTETALTDRPEHRVLR
jgi:hypothetical protein